MAHWIGVVGSKEGVDRLRANDETWWCAPKAATAGEQIAIYVAKNRIPKLSEDEAGVTAIFEIIGPEPARQADCRQFGGGFGRPIAVPVKIAVRKRFPKSLRLAEMRDDAMLSQATFVKRSFQGTIFPASQSQFSRITELLSLKQQR